MVSIVPVLKEQQGFSICSDTWILRAYARVRLYVRLFLYRVREKNREAPMLKRSLYFRGRRIFF